MVIVPKVWELIEHFKNRCRLRGWKACEHEDLVEAQGEYHNFLWMHRVHPSTFKNVVMNPCCSIREGITYRTVRASYMAWVLHDSPPESVGQAIIEEPNLSKRVAIYDLSQAYAGRPLCLKINETDSVVFQEFEKFLNIEYELELRPIYRLPPLPPQSIPSEPMALSQQEREIKAVHAG